MKLRPPVGRRVLRMLLLGPAVLLLSLVLPVRPASAHPLDVYVQASYLTLTPSAVTVEIDLSPGVLVAPRVLEQLDVDRNGAISDAEARSYLQQVVTSLQLQVDGRTRTLRLTDLDVPSYLTLQAGYGTLKAFATTTPTTTSAGEGEHVVFYRNGFAGEKATYQVNAFVGSRAPIGLGRQQRDPGQQQATVTYRVVASAPAAAAQDRTSSATGSSRLAGYLADSSLSAWAVLVALGAAAVLGALHALTPGHAKTLIAAYLVGSGGTLRNAVTLGAVVTVTHTAAVITIGLVALLASQFIVPGVLVPALETLSGLLVLGLGLRLLRLRWPRRARTVEPARELAGVGAGHQHGPGGSGHLHGAGDDLAHGTIGNHHHGPGGHVHTVPTGPVTARSLVAMGVSGGLVPCPEALGVMVLAVGVKRTVLGLGLILSFSLGLAAVLIGLGVLLVRSRTLLTRLDRLPSGWTTLLPLVSAAVVTVLGAGLVLKAVGAALPV